MKYAIDDIKSYYLKISQAYIKIAIVLNAAGQWEESLKLTEEYKDYFDKNMPYKFTIKFAGQFDYDAAANSGNLGNLKIIEGDLLINKDNLLWGEKRMDQAAFECVSRLSLQNVTDQLNSEEFRNKIIKFAETNITDPAEIKEYKIEPKIERIYFTENEYLDSINRQKIFDADERICVKVVLNIYNRFYQRPIEITLKSSVSGRNKIVKTTPWRGYGLYYALFQPNETQDPSDSTKNLIETDPRQMNPEPLASPPTEEDMIPISSESPSQPEPPLPPIPIIAALKTPLIKTISIFQGEWETNMGVSQLEVPPSLYNHKQCLYFDKRLVRSYIDTTTDDFFKNTTINSKWFLQSGGAEWLVGTYQGVSAHLLCKHTATWFIIQGHSNVQGSIGEKEGDISVTPLDLFWKKGTNYYSRYSGIDVLILDACFSMNRYKAWMKVVPKGVVLGYYDKVSFDKNYGMAAVLERMTYILNGNLNITPHQICNAWANLNRIIYRQYADSNIGNKIYAPWSYSYTINGECFYGEKTKTSAGKPTVVTSKR